MANHEEVLPVVDEAGKVIGQELRSVCHDGVSKMLHPVVHLHVYDPIRGLLLQKRSAKKKIQPGRWDTAVGGHVSYGEDMIEALSREVEEEIGLNVSESSGVCLMSKYVFESAVERELVHSYYMLMPPDGVLKISEPEDIDELRFWPIDDILGHLGYGVFTPNFEQEFRSVVLPYINNFV